MYPLFCKERGLLHEPLLIIEKVHSEFGLIVKEPFRRRGLSPWNKYSLLLTAPSFTRLATSELFSGHVESKVSLQCSVGRLIIVGDCLEWFRKSSVATNFFVCSLVDLHVLVDLK